MSEINLKEVSSKKDLNNFISFPFELYKNDPNWVPVLRSEVTKILNPKHPFYQKATIKSWLALKDKKIVGRISAVINQAHNEFHNEKCGFVGFFESINDQEVANLLLKTAESHLKKNGMELIQGTASPSTNYECGILIEGFDDPPQIMMTYNPPYYQLLFENAGYEKAKDLLAYRLNPDFKMPEKIVRSCERAEKSNNITYRFINKSKWDQEILMLREIYNQAWEKNWGFVPMSEEEFLQMGKDLKQVIDEKLIMIVEVKGEAAGFMISLPDLNQIIKNMKNGKLLPFNWLKIFTQWKKINRLRVITLGVKHKYRNLGLASILFMKGQEVILNSKKYTEAEFSWILEDNLLMNKPLLLIKAEVYKKYRIFEKRVSL